MLKIALVRGLSVGKTEIHHHEVLTKYFDIELYVLEGCKEDLSTISIPTKIFHWPDEFIWKILRKRGSIINSFYSRVLGLRYYMPGLEKTLRRVNIVNTLDPCFTYSYQAIQAKKKYGIKVVVFQSENIPFHYESIKKKEMMKEVRENADMIITISKRAKEALLLEGVSEDRVCVIPLGTETTRFKPREKNEALLRQVGIEKEDFVILFAGRLVWPKGVYDLVHAGKKIIQDMDPKVRSIKFLLLGEGREKEGMKKLIEELGLKKNFILPGKIPHTEIHRYYNLANIFVFPSIPTRWIKEQFGHALIEAMASGLPILATLCGAIPEVVGDCGILVQPNDFVSLSQQIKRLIIDNNLRKELAIKARRRVEDKFDANKVAERIKEIYLKVSVE